MPWSDYPLRTLTLPQDAGPNDPREVFGVNPIPPELVAYYLTAPLATTPPETVVWADQYFDGQGNYAYRAEVVDSSAPKITSLVQGAVVAGAVNESERFRLNPGVVLGNARYQSFTEENILILTSTNAATTILAAQKPTDAFHRFSVNVNGTIGLGDGTALTDVYIARNAADTGIEVGQSVRMRGFGSVLNDAIIILTDGEAHERYFVQFDGYTGWGNGTNLWDTDLYRAGAGILETAVRFRIGGSHKDVAASCAGVNNACGAGTYAAGAYANVPATSSFSFVKQFTATRIKIDFHITIYSTVAATGVKFGVLINGVDYDVCGFFFNEANTHRQISGTAYVAGGLAAGTYTVQARWQRTGGTGTLTTDANDWISMSGMETSS